MSFPNCLCKLKYFTIYLRDLILERSEWNAQQKQNWPILHDFIGITILAILKNEGFKFLKKNTFRWVKYDDEVNLKNFRLINGQILICSRLNGFTKFINVFIIDCEDGEIYLSGQVHNSDEEEHLDCYELKTKNNIAGCIHFAPCGGYYRGEPVYLQYDVPRLLQSINKVIDPIKDYITHNWQYKNMFQYFKHTVPEFISDSIFGDKARTDEKELDELNEGKFRSRHTNPDELMFLSPEMCEAQKCSGVILYHYRDDESLTSSNSSISINTGNKSKTLIQTFNYKEEFQVNRKFSESSLTSVNCLAPNFDQLLLDYGKTKIIHKCEKLYMSTNN